MWHTRLDVIASREVRAIATDGIRVNEYSNKKNVRGVHMGDMLVEATKSDCVGER